MRVLGLLGALDPYKYKLLVKGVGAAGAGASKEVAQDQGERGAYCTCLGHSVLIFMSASIGLVS